MTEDAELLRRCAEARSEGAFAELVQRHVDLVYSAALRRLGGDAHGAADVAQQVFISLARQGKSLARHTVLPAWLYAATRNVAIDHIRAEQRRKVREQEAQYMHELNSNSEADNADWTQLRPALDAAMDELGERDRAAVLLRFFARRPFAEIGRALDLSEDAARMRVDRALEKLRTRLAQRGVTSTAVALGAALSQATIAAPSGLAASVTGGALASATAAGVAGLVAGIVQFMSMSKIMAGVAALALATLIATAGYEARVNRGSETVRRNAQRENEVLVARLRELQQRADAAEKSREAALKAAVAPRVAAAPAPRMDPAAEAQALLAGHPEVKQALIGYQRASLRTTYGSLFRTLRLTPEQVDRCLDLLLMQGSQRQVAGPNGPLRFKLEGNPAEAERQLHELFGDEGFKQYRDFVSDMTSIRAPLASERNKIVTPPLQLASALHQTSTPLDAAQAQRLTQILGASLVPVEWSTSRQYDWDKIAAEARGILSEPQFAMFERQGKSDQYLQAMNRFLFQQRQAAAVATPPSR